MNRGYALVAFAAALVLTGYGSQVEPEHNRAEQAIDEAERRVDAQRQYDEAKRAQRQYEEEQRAATKAALAESGIDVESFTVDGVECLVFQNSSGALAVSCNW